jgi:signal transduction histidine kinase
MATILIVEDESIIARGIADRLEQMGHVISAIVGSGEEAIAQAAFVQPDLVLMDIILQGDIDGIEAAERIQTDFHVPVVYLTAYADRDTLRRARFTEPFGYILKPFRDLEFDATIEMALSRFQAESRMLKEIEALEELIHIRSRYTALVAHEFRIPWSDLRDSTRVLNQGDRYPTQARDLYLQRIHTALTHMKLLLMDVEAFSNMQSMLPFSPVPLDLVQFCQELIAEMQLGIETQNPIIFTSPPDLPLACMDERLLRHIFTNLLSNAIKYSPQGNSIYFDLRYAPTSSSLESEQSTYEPVTTEAIAQTPQSVDTDIPSLTVEFQIRDQGIGIPIHSQDRLFEGFYRADNVGNIPGMGMGLAIARQCVDLHQGSLTFVSEPGLGTTFTVMLPLWSDLEKTPIL